MIGVYHSTALNLVAKHCHYALELQEQRVPYARDVFAVGIACHAVIEGVYACTNELGRVLTEEEVNVSALGVCERLMRDGRSYDGKGEPPMKPDAVFAGQELALNWLLGVEPAQPGAMVEQGLGLDGDGQPTEYWKGDGLKIRTILDVVTKRDEADEESARTVLTVRDWKTAWSTDESELETLQRRVQAIAAWRYFGPADVLRLEIVNLRLQKTYTKDLFREDGLDAQIAEWWGQVAVTVKALDAQKAFGPRPASPGAGCMGCSYLQACPHAGDYIERRGMHKTDEQRAIAYAVASAMREELAEELRLSVEGGSIPVPGGVVGYAVKERTKLAPEAYATLAQSWEENDGEILGFAKAANLTKANAEKILRALYPERADSKTRAEMLAAMTEPDQVREFGIFPADNS